MQLAATSMPGVGGTHLSLPPSEKKREKKKGKRRKKASASTGFSRGPGMNAFVSFFFISIFVVNYSTDPTQQTKHRFQWAGSGLRSDTQFPERNSQPASNMGTLQLPTRPLLAAQPGFD